METFTQCMAEIESAIRLRRIGDSKSYLLVYKDSHFLCLNGLRHTDAEIIIARLSDKDCREGLDTKAWNIIETKIRALLLQRVIK